jgi:SepF-like predicted cell division protein (DUF552 family)
MGLLSKIFGENDRDKDRGEYVELSSERIEMEGETEQTVRIARIDEKNDTVAIKDAVYDGDVVIADITRHTTQDRTMEHIIDELKQATNEVGGDIIQKDDDQLILTPADVEIDRDRLV